MNGRSGDGRQGPTEPLLKRPRMQIKPWLGATQFGASDERRSLPEGYLRARLVVAMGGRKAEQVVLGDISSGAENDLAAPTIDARNMVQRWSMGSRVGPIAVPGAEGQPGLLLADPRSPELANLVDRETSAMVREAQARTEQLLIAHRVELHRLVSLLEEQETLDRAQIEAALGDLRGAQSVVVGER